MNGFVLVDKPPGMSSAAVVGRLKWLLKNHAGAPKNLKIGHGGTLDPFATGLLPIGVGRATKALQGLLNGPKAYEFTLKLGTHTTTGDYLGEVLATAPVPGDVAARLPAVLAGLTGEIVQTPPAFSALKVGGKRAYALARAGQPVALAPRPVVVEELRLLGYKDDEIQLVARVSKGTYIRVLGEDVAKNLGTVGHLTALRRTVHGGLSLAQPQVLGLEALDKAIQSGAWEAYLLPLDAPLASS